MKQPRLLIVDDEADLLAELKPLLERSGFEAVSAADGEQALSLVSRSGPDLIVLDVLMPRLDGRETLRRLRQSGDWTPVILLTQVGTPSERAMSLQEGADDYLNKPFDPLELIARIRAVLRRTQRGNLPLTSFRRLASGELLLDRHTRQVSLGNENAPEVFGVPPSLSMVRLNPADVSQLTSLRPDSHVLREALWAGDASGALIVDATQQPSDLWSPSGPLTWLGADGRPALALPVQGNTLRWGK